MRFCGVHGAARALCASIFGLAILLPPAVRAQSPAPQDAPPKSQQRNPPIEQGKFILHKFEQPIGQETYEITKDGDSLIVKMDFEFTDRGTAVPLTASFRGAADLTPQSFEIKGKNSRTTSIDDAVEVQSEKVRVRDRDKWTEDARPAEFFTIAGYAPATMQMLMVRYWATHGSPAQLVTLPNGKVKIEPRGQDSVNIDGKNQTFDRFTVEGLIWGRETLWFDSSRNLIAAVTTDAEFDHFEAIRDGYESGLGTFVGRAGSDEMAALADISKGISGSHAEKIAIVGGTLIDGTGHDPIPDSVVVIEKGRILAAGPESQRTNSSWRSKSGRARQDDSARLVGHARAFRAGRMGADLSGRRRDDGSRLRQRIRIHHRGARCRRQWTWARTAPTRLPESWMAAARLRSASNAWIRPNKPGCGRTNTTTPVSSR